ncbi:hypothetical protein [Mucilaginibacter sp.]|uniref:hypothetical protein n=1 Tax=Mucilaginibacter sp. TaxID=1882438 RepID=UPI003D0B3937
MVDHQTLILITAISSLAGALLTQLMTGFFSYFNDRRKYKQELKNTFRNRRTEIGESFYFMNGEVMTIVQKNIAYWHNLHRDRSEDSLQYLHREMEKLTALNQRLNEENWKYNLVGIYYEVPFPLHEILQENKKTHALCLRILDLSAQIKVTLPQEQVDLYREYNLVIFELCAQYESVYSRMQDNMTCVKAALLADYL